MEADTALEPAVAEHSLETPQSAEAPADAPTTTAADSGALSKGPSLRNSNHGGDPETSLVEDAPLHAENSHHGDLLLADPPEQQQEAPGAAAAAAAAVAADSTSHTQEATTLNEPIGQGDAAPPHPQPVPPTGAHADRDALNTETFGTSQTADHHEQQAVAAAAAVDAFDEDAALEAALEDEEAPEGAEGADGGSLGQDNSLPAAVQMTNQSRRGSQGAAVQEGHGHAADGGEGVGAGEGHLGAGVMRGVSAAKAAPGADRQSGEGQSGEHEEGGEHGAEASEEQHQDHKRSDTETAAQRLTEPTAFRMLKALEKTQGGKTEWHIATGVTFKQKRLTPDEMSTMVDRLCTVKSAGAELGRPHAVRLVYEGTKESYVPVKEVTKEENIAYMSELYSRCQETRQKTKQQLADKYLQPLPRPAAAARKVAIKGKVQGQPGAAAGGAVAGAEAGK